MKSGAIPIVRAPFRLSKTEQERLCQSVKFAMGVKHIWNYIKKTLRRDKLQPAASGFGRETLATNSLGHRLSLHGTPDRNS